MPSGLTLGFTNVVMWADSSEACRHKLENYLARYKWKLLSVDRVELIDSEIDRGDEINRLMDEALQNPNAILLSTFHGYKPD